MTQTPIKVNSLEEYLNFDDGTDTRYELTENGVLTEVPPGTGKHEAIITLLVVRFFLEKQRLGLALEPRPNGTEVLTNARPRRPDVLVMTAAQAQAIENSSAILMSPPPLLVEVVSPESVKRDYETKLNEYAAIGVAEYWIVDPIVNKVTVCLLGESNYQQAVFTGNQRIVSGLFPELVLSATEALLG